MNPANCSYLKWCVHVKRVIAGDDRRLSAAAPKPGHRQTAIDDLRTKPGPGSHCMQRTSKMLMKSLLIKVVIKSHAGRHLEYGEHVQE